MTKTILLISTCILFFSCAKKIEERLIGEWKLDTAYKKDLFGRDYFQTGYESGRFTFYESGAAAYVNNTDTLSGYWKADYYSQSRYNSNTGNNDSELKKYLEVFLANFSRNKILSWKFDEFHFRNGWKCIRATEYSLGRDRVYEFVKP